MLGIDPKLAGKLAGVFVILAYLPYVITILQEKTRPSRTTWFTWLILDILALTCYKSVGADETAWVTVGFTIGASIVATLSIKYGENSWSRLDTICSAGAVVCLSALLFLDNPLTALLINLFVTLLGAMPTFKKAYLDPGSENKLAWSLFLVGCLVNFLAVKKWTFVIAIYPIVILLIDGPIAALVLCPSIRFRTKPGKDKEAPIV